ncbi:PD-(D/E)XK nuclease family protein [Flavobacterium sp. D11R37]|uniref:PD-(D/E)XK nuclease family protein n=1 Tax=Flavobacterium coralii TaxID=2838017 RepID=UPI001CA791D9|nr:PD-(D/E)XK nuclease family protein [Flavobacterium coralii]MBY8963044.1 PD-(D/E)XK nuclease family protein [Flavobacterium coralii]
MEEFNMFKILNKDDKELIHSAFIRYLMLRNNCFYNFINAPLLKYDIPILEKAYTTKVNRKNKKYRIDIEVSSFDKSTIIIIENKFKSFPNNKQLECYDRIYNEKYNGIRIIKYLFCFDKNIFKNTTEWIVFDYNDLIDYIKIILSKVNSKDERIFIQHYLNFLNEYIEKYSILKADFSKLLINQSNNENKFWLKIFYSALEIRLHEYFKKEGITINFFF